MTRSGRFLGGLAFTYGYQGILMVAGLLLTPFYLRKIGQHDYGLWLVATQLLTYLTLTDFGVVALLPQETAYATGRAGGSGNAKDLPEIVGQTIRLVLYQLPIVMVLALALWLTIPADWYGLRWPLGIIMLGYVIAFPLRVLPALLQGLQDLAFCSALQIVTWTISTAVTVWMVFAGWSLTALAVGWLISQTVTTPLYVYRLRTRYPEVLPKGLPQLTWDRARKKLGKGSWTSVAQIAQLLMGNTDLLIIGKVLGPSAVVPYACTSKLVNVLANQVNMLMHVASPGLCELKTAGTRLKLFQVVVALNHGILSFSGLVFCVTLLLNQWFVTTWVTASQYGGFALTGAILVNMLFVHWDTVAAYTVFCFGHQRRISLTNLGNGLMTAGACLGLTLLMGPIGAPLGSLAGTALVGLPFNLSVIAKDVGVSLPRLAISMLGSWSWRFGILAAATWAVAQRWSPKNLLEATAAGVCVTTVYLAVMIPNIMSSTLGDYIRPRLRQVSRRIRGVSEGVAVS
jgi:O-antigen/teichoic acid export membrane protein